MRWFRRTPKDIVIPEDSRVIETPIDGSGERTISDLFPVSAITSTYPVIHTQTVTGTTYGALTFGRDNKPDGDSMTDFDAYTCRKIEPVPNTRFCRLYFARVFSELEKETSFKSVTYFDEDEYLPPILFRIKILEDRTAPHVTRGPGGNEIYVPHYYSRVYYVDEQNGALIQETKFISDVPFNIGMCETFRPTTVSYDYYGLTDAFRKCLHPKMIFDAKQTAFVAYNAGTVEISGSVSGQIFEATNYETWDSHIKSDKQVAVGLLFERTKKLLIPPEVPAISKK